jgi:hypothetical protein
MEAKQFTLKAKTPKNQAILNRTIKALVKYNNLNNQRDKADDSGDEKLYRKLNRQCEVAFDNYLELAEGLPKYEKDRLENSDVYLHYAKGGMTEHGLKIGDKITGRNHGDKIEGYNKEMRETFTTDLDKGKRSSIRYAKGGRTKKAKEPMVVRSYFEDEAIDYAKGGKTMKTKLVDDDYASANAMKEKEIERVRLQFSKNQPKNEFQKSIQTRIEQSILKLAWDGVFAGVKDNNLDIVIKSLFYDFRIIGEDGIYYASHKIENYSQEVIKERNTTYGKGGSILSSNYSIGGL